MARIQAAVRGRAFPLYVGAVVTAGGVLLVAVLLTTRPATMAGADPVAFWTFALLLLLSELKPLEWLRRRADGDITGGWVFAFALLLLSPSDAALILLAIAGALGDVTRGKPAIKVAFNIGQSSLALGAGALVLELLPYRDALLSEAPLSLGYVPAVALAGFAVFSVNGLLLCGVVALSQGHPLRAVIRRNAALTGSTDGMLLALAPIFVATAQRSLVLLPPLLLTAYAVHHSARLAFAREYEATHDLLTDLPNRRLFLERVEAAIGEGQRRGSRSAVLLLDLDGFKDVNDRLGHQSGDAVLEAVAERLSEGVRPADTVARLGGDEFAVLLRGVADLAAARRLAEGLLATVVRPINLGDLPVSVGGSLGVTLFPDQGEDVRVLLEHADAAMYEAKRRGGGVTTYVQQEGHSTGRGRLALLGELHGAIERDQLRMDYQPKVDSRTGRVVGVEALARWLHPRLGLIPPEEFLPIAEQTELCDPLTQRLLGLALAQCAAWQRDGIEVPVAVNCSARNLHDLRFPRTVARLLDEAGLAAGWLELEFTESTVLANPTRAAAVLAELSQMGVSLAIDDFGTGYSSLANLRDLPVHSVKIDPSFVARMATSRGDGLIVRSIVELAANLGLRTIAEGVEDDRTWRILAGLGCDVVQGHAVARPADPETLAAWLRARSEPDPHLIPLE